MSKMKNLVILERGEWAPKQIEIHQIVENRKSILFYDRDVTVIEESWQGVLAKNPKAFPGPTIRLAGRHHLGEEMVLEVLPSDYKEGATLSFLAVAMVPVTSDNCIALQGPVSSVAATIGGGIRVPGCTPQHIGVFTHIITEMKDEFNVDVNVAKDLNVLGLIEVRPPIAKLHHGLVVKVKLPHTKEELQKCWQGAKDKWEGKLEFLEIQSHVLGDFVRLEDLGGQEAFNRQSLLILAMVVDSEFSTNYIEKWSKSGGWA